jgi:hypothetical protein
MKNSFPSNKNNYFIVALIETFNFVCSIDLND